MELTVFWYTFSKKNIESTPTPPLRNRDKPATHLDVKFTKENDLNDVLLLYKFLFPDEDFRSTDVIKEKWKDIIDDKNPVVT